MCEQQLQRWSYLGEQNMAFIIQSQSGTLKLTPAQSCEFALRFIV